MMLEKGIYAHYKGPQYQVHDVAKHSETEEWMVVYSPLYGDEASRHLWVRPLTMFTESVEIDGVAQPRFKLIES
ncbi:DUF1653 domain-containing protein [Alteromonas sp. 5E99-2]|uniref:DUF1653 domain-containing protein n=1 Tax=Alteromonas sp. 5E99-2 TaxID=2817683 RepID=UPI001A99F67D|nr:DUF1653 domain-containing protein [Alteromonas sp. 5E99-2]